jgi:hypothetical protein
MGQEKERGTARKDAIRAYKERTPPRGVFAVRCAATGQVWVGAAPTLDTMQNRLWFMLRHGQHRNAALQAAWREHGEAAFRYEILEQLAAEVPASRQADVLKARTAYWTAALGAAAVEH